MPKYCLEQFNNDMTQLGGMIENFYSGKMKGGENTIKNKSMKNIAILEQDVKQLEKNITKLNKSMTKSNSSMKTKSMTSLNSSIKTKSKNKSNIRHFKIETVEGKPYTFEGRYSGREPKLAARKVVKHICEKLNMGKGCKINSFEIKEITRGSSKKVYGPYTSNYVKLDKPRILTFKKTGAKINQTHAYIIKLKK
jgi:hypothetical protein